MVRYERFYWAVFTVVAFIVGSLYGGVVGVTREDVRAQIVTALTFHAMEPHAPAREEIDKIKAELAELRQVVKVP